MGTQEETKVVGTVRRKMREKEGVRVNVCK